jgi:hypothetical protein
MNVVDVAHVLRDYPVFRNTSLRHLTDLVELARPDAKVLPFRATEKITGAFVLALRGRAVAQGQFLLTPGEVFWSLLPAILFDAASFAVGRDVGGFSRRRLTDFLLLLEQPLDVEGTAADDTLVLPLTEDLLRNATLASTSFAKSVDLRPLGHPGSLYDFFLNKYPREKARRRRSPDEGT